MRYGQSYGVSGHYYLLFVYSDRLIYFSDNSEIRDIPIDPKLDFIQINNQ